MTSIRLARTVRLPDPDRLARFRVAPHLGSKPLFFGGGSALRGLSESLKEYTHNSIHLITPFDSGGSSAHIRKSFRMLAVGDLRNRLMALADDTLAGNPSVFDLFAYRLPIASSQEELRRLLDSLVDGRNPRISVIEHPMRKIIRSHLRFFREAMPESFDLRGANIGNLILAGGFINQGRHIDPVIFLFSELVRARGLVRPVANMNLHLVAELEDGTTLVGQHLMTGKEEPPISSSIRRLYLSRTKTEPVEVVVPIRRRVARLISRADLICYPMGSFYSSLMANLLLAGVGKAIAENDVPKVYVPNRGVDPEQLGLGLARGVEILVDTLRRSAGEDLPTDRLLQYCLVDSSAREAEPEELDRISRMGIEVVEQALVSERSRPLIDAGRLARVLMSMS